MTRDELIKHVVNATLGDFAKHAGLALLSPAAGKFPKTPEGMAQVVDFMLACASELSKQAGALTFADWKLPADQKRIITA